MANDEHIGVLGRGAAAWNAWRAENSDAPDLSRAGLRGLDLSGFDLSQADLRQADSPRDELERGGPVERPLGGCELLQSGARWRQPSRGLLDRSSIS